MNFSFSLFFSPVVCLAIGRGIGVTLLLPLGGVKRSLSLGTLLGLWGASIAPHSGSPTLLSLPYEVLLGCFLSVPIALTVYGAGLLGQFVEASRGQLMSELVSPLSSDHFNALAELLRNYLWVRILFYGGGTVLLRVFLQSSLQCPFGEVKIEQLYQLGELSFSIVVLLLENVLLLFLPFALAFLVVDLGIIIAGKIFPGGSWNNESFLGKLWLGAVVLGCTLQAEMESHFLGKISQITLSLVKE